MKLTTIFLCRFHRFATAPDLYSNKAGTVADFIPDTCRSKRCRRNRNGLLFGSPCIVTLFYHYHNWTWLTSKHDKKLPHDTDSMLATTCCQKQILTETYKMQNGEVKAQQQGYYSMLSPFHFFSCCSLSQLHANCYKDELTNRTPVSCTESAVIMLN